ncbi:erythromycin esterase [Aspergillus sclerotialis]|uniref:Erythromycin esterase n=1 Tax=Aspergillus sclerotialis TaxID=2070753 RepID=A0A3A2ZG06_9EURO|nr:erythromycin esterase [Aspergillus sclerotialis]
MEREEPSDSPSKVETVRTPVKSPGQKTPSSSNKKESVNAKTPTNSSAVRPTLNEMHPSKVRQSTTKQPDSGLILGFNPVKRDSNGNALNDTAIQNTPSKITGSPSTQFGTPGFEYQFSCQESQLSDEAKKLMESVREDVARIKSQMTADKGKQIDAEREADALQGGRKIAKPKGKAGRFSDAHMAEFKKMDSIAGHASAFRATPGRFQPVSTPLKRTSSKIRLGEPSSNASPSKSPVKRSPIPTETGAKRVKHDKADDASSSRSPSKGANIPKPANSRARPRPTVRSSLMTPTKSSLARTSASVRPQKTSMIPSVSGSPAPKGVSSPHTPKTDFNPRFKSHLPTLNGLKSILRRHQPLFSKDPAKIAAGTHVAAPDFSSDMLMSGGDSSGEPQTPSPKKHVEFSASTKSRYELAQASPSPSKIPVVQPRSGSDVTYPVLPALTPEKPSTAEKPASTKTKPPSIRQVRPSDAASQVPKLPELPSVPHGIGNKKRHREETDDEVDSENVPPADATERSAKRVKIATPTPAKTPSSSPLKGRTNAPRQPTPGRAGTPATAKKKKAGLSLSRLNMLAKPKHRA